MRVVTGYIKHPLLTVLYLGFLFFPFIFGTVQFLKEILGGPRTFQERPQMSRIFYLVDCFSFEDATI